MDVILLERIEKLGQMGDIVTVKPGFARNYLLPQKKAMRATKENMGFFENQRKQLEAENLKRREEAQAVSGDLDGMVVPIIRSAGESGQLYGSVSARNISEAVTAAGVTIARSQVQMDRPVKTLGLHEFRIHLHPEVVVAITINVARSTEEAEQQARLGRAVLGEDDRLEQAEVEEMAEQVFEQPDSVAEELANDFDEAVETVQESDTESGEEEEKTSA